MWRERVIPEEDLDPHLTRYGDRSLSSRMKALYDHQKLHWPEFRSGHDAMKTARIRRIKLGGCWVLCQFTPHRMASVSASVDPNSILGRPCFLCPHNLYPEEKGLAFANDYLILCNVSPVFDFHLVIIHRNHVPQQIEPHFDTLLGLTRDLSPDFVVIYNGSRCGASAPDHLHFQAFPAQILPLESQIRADRGVEVNGVIVKRDGILIAAPQGFFRHFLIFESTNPTILSSWFGQTLEALANEESAAREPMINLVMGYTDGQWKVILFPRERHRPRCYDGPGRSQLLISPGAIDMSGVFVIPRKQDYDAVEAETLRGIYQEVTLHQDRFTSLIRELTGRK